MPDSLHFLFLNKIQVVMRKITVLLFLLMGFSRFLILSHISILEPKKNAPIGISVGSYLSHWFLKIDHSKLYAAINEVNNTGT